LGIWKPWEFELELIGKTFWENLVEWKNKELGKVLTQEPPKFGGTFFK